MFYDTVIELFTSVIYKYSSARVFAIDKPFQPSLIFWGKARAYPSEIPFGRSTFGQGPSLTKTLLQGTSSNQQTLDEAGKV
jgi:hypothetical protein